MSRMYIDDVVAECDTKRGHTMRMGVLIVLVVAILGIIVLTMFQYQDNQAQIVTNMADIGQLKAKIAQVEVDQMTIQEQQENLKNGVDDGSYYHPKNYADKLSKLQNGFCTGAESAYIKDAEIEGRVQKQTKQLIESNLIDTTQMEFLKPWYPANRLAYSWTCLTKLASVVPLVPVVWECTDESGYVCMVVIGTFDNSESKLPQFTDLVGYVTYYGQEAMNSGKTISSMNIDTNDVVTVVDGMNRSKDLGQAMINLQPVADAIHIGTQFSSVDEIAQLAEQSQ